MASTHGSPESYGFTVFDHYSVRSRHQSVEKVNANASTLVRKARTDRGRDAAREGGDAIAGSPELHSLAIQGTTNQKKGMGRKRRR
jgi:hypothetical protein